MLIWIPSRVVRRETPSTRSKTTCLYAIFKFRCSVNPRTPASLVSPTSSNNISLSTQRKKNRHNSASDSRSESFLMSELKPKPKSSNASLRSLQRTEEPHERRNEALGNQHERSPAISSETEYVQLEVCLIFNRIPFRHQINTYDRKNPFFTFPLYQKHKL